MCKARLVAGLMTLVLVVAPWVSVSSALAASAAEINKDASAALARLYEKVPEARTLGADAKGILIFPSIVKAGFLFGGQYGEACCARGAGTRDTTTRSPRHMVFRPACRASGTRCSS